jgi:iron complex transport system substrate-binding protein
LSRLPGNFDARRLLASHPAPRYLSWDIASTTVSPMLLPWRLAFIAVLLLSGPVPSAAQVTVTDDLHRTVTLPAAARRIISLAPSITESLFAIGAGELVVGVTEYCTFPPEAARRVRVGGMITPSIETIVSLKPDLILVSMEGNLREDFLRLTDLDVPVVVTNPRTLDDIASSIRLLGTLAGHTDEADSLVRRLAARRRHLQDGVTSRSQRVLMFVSLQPLIAVGPGTFLHDLLTSAGASNLAAHTGMTYPAYSREAVTAGDPDVLLILSDALPALDGVTALFPEWERLTAFRNGRVFLVDADLVSRPGPRAVDGLELLVSLIQTGRP